MHSRIQITPEKEIVCVIVSPIRMYSGGILWFSHRYAAASAFHRLRDNFTNPFQIASILYM